MKSFEFKSIYPYLLALLTFLILIYAYFNPVFQGKTINQSDYSSYVGASHEIKTYQEEGDGQVMWTNSVFSGMPATTISLSNPGNIFPKLNSVLYWGPRPMADLVLGMFGFFLLLLAFGVNVWLSIIGAIAFAFCSYNFQIIQVGHNTKVSAMAWMPWVFATFVYTLRKHQLLGGVLFAITLSLELYANHPQVTYYLAFLLLAFWIGEVVNNYRGHTMRKLWSGTLILFVAACLAFGSNLNRLWPTYEYSKYTMRGGAELKEVNKAKQQSQGGLDKEYATMWSYGVGETFNLLIPNFNGGASGGNLPKDSHTLKFLKQQGAPNAEELANQPMPLYWGPQPFTAGPMYMGAVSIFLFVLGLFLVKGVMKWWIVGSSIFVLFLGWGRHFMWLTSLFYDYFPLYNKFRVPSMILILLELIIPLFGFYALNRLCNEKEDKKKVMYSLKWATIVVGGICLLFALFPSLAGSFVSNADSNYPDWLRQVLPLDRESLLRSDAFRSLFLVLATTALVYLGYTKKIKYRVCYIALAILVLVDLWTVDRRYMNDSHFVNETTFNNAFALRPVDKEILKDKDPYYRVLDLSVNTFNDSHGAYNHKMIGGYSAAKLQRYQDMIDLHIQPEIAQLAGSVNKGVALDSILPELHVINMLNGKYIIANPNSMPIYNASAYGNAWFVDSVVYVSTPDEEILKLNTVNPRNTAILMQGEQVQLSAPADSNATIILTQYHPNRLTYRSSNPKDGLAVFSEVYYPKGWKAFIDGNEVDILRTDYILRALQIPKGEHEIVFQFAPESYRIGAIIAYTCSGILVVLLIVALLMLWNNKKKANK